MGNLNNLIKRALKRELDLDKDATDADLIYALLEEDYDYNEIRPLLKGMKFTEKELIKLSSASLQFFKDKVRDKYKANADFVLRTFASIGKNNIYETPMDYFAYISPDLREDLDFLVEALKLDGNILLTDEFDPKYYENELIRSSAEAFYKDAWLSFKERLLYSLDKSIRDTAEQINALKKSRIQIGFTISINEDYAELTKRLEKETKLLNFLKSLNTFKNETGSKPE